MVFVKLLTLHSLVGRRVTNMKDLKISYLLDIYGAMLTKTQYEMVDLYYNDDLSLGEIAGHFNITRQGVRDSIKRGETLLLEYEQKLRFSDKVTKLKLDIDEITDRVKKIESICSSNFYSKAVLEEVDIILRTVENISIDKDDV